MRAAALLALLLASSAPPLFAPGEPQGGVERAGETWSVRTASYAASLESNPERRAASKQRALDLVWSALEHGQDLEKLKRDPLLRVVHAELNGLTLPPAPPKPTRAVLFVDPVPDLFSRSGLQPTGAR